MDQKTANAAAQAFIKFYYPTLSKDCAKLAAVYKDKSTLTWGNPDGKSVDLVGPKEIGQRLMAFSKTKPEHKISSVDVQTLDNNRLLVMVTGDVNMNGSAIKFAQTFQLIPTDQKSFWIFNDIFRVEKLA
jgi:hypothetical protein